MLESLVAKHMEATGEVRATRRRMPRGRADRRRRFSGAWHRLASGRHRGCGRSLAKLCRRRPADRGQGSRHQQRLLLLGNRFRARRARDGQNADRPRGSRVCRLREQCAIGHAWQPRSSPGGGRQGQSCCQWRLHWIGLDSSIPLLRYCHNVCPQCHHLSVVGTEIFGFALSAAVTPRVSQLDAAISTSRRLLSRPPHRKRSERGPAPGREGVCRQNSRHGGSRRFRRILRCRRVKGELGDAAG